MSSALIGGGNNGPIAAGAAVVPTPVKTAAYTANPGDFVPVDTSAGAVPITLPPQPADQTAITVMVINQGAALNAVTVATSAGDFINSAGGPTTWSMPMLYQRATFQYVRALGIWYVISDGLPLTQGKTPGFAAAGFTAPAVVALTDGATINTNAALGNDFRVTIAGNRTLANPTNPTDGQKIVFHVTQDATGSRLLTYGAAFDFGTAGAPTLTVTAAKTDLLHFVYNAAASKWFYEGSNLGM